VPDWVAFPALVVAFIGLLILIMGIIWIPAKRKLAKELAFLDQFPLQPCGEVARNPRWGQFSAVEGTSAPGPDGPLTAPLSGTPCIWCHITVTRVMQESIQQGPDTSVHTRTWSEPVWETTAGEPFAVADSSGQVAVSAALVGANSTWLTMYATEKIIEPSCFEKTDRRQPPKPHLQNLIATGVVDPERVRFTGDLVRVDVEERIIRPGKHLYVLAVPQPRNGYPVLSPNPRGYSAISTYPREVVAGREPLPGVRTDPPSGCAIPLLIVDAVLTFGGIVLAFLAVRPG
jgi:hypothetical protein